MKSFFLHSRQLLHRYHHHPILPTTIQTPIYTTTHKAFPLPSTTPTLLRTSTIASTTVTHTKGLGEALLARRDFPDLGSANIHRLGFVETGAEKEKEKEEQESPPLARPLLSLLPLPPLPLSNLNPSSRPLALRQAPPSPSRRTKADPERIRTVASTRSKRTPSSPRRSSNARPLLSSPLLLLLLSMLGLLLHRLILRSIPWLRLHLNRPILSSSGSRRSIINTCNVWKNAVARPSLPVSLHPLRLSSIRIFIHRQHHRSSPLRSSLITSTFPCLPS
jgi:hypothetical protein